jgi:hypothetical protein
MRYWAYVLKKATDEVNISLSTDHRDASLFVQVRRQCEHFENHSLKTARVFSLGIRKVNSLGILMTIDEYD